MGLFLAVRLCKLVFQVITGYSPIINSKLQ